MLTLTNSEHNDAGKLTKHVLRWVRETSADVAWLFRLGAIISSVSARYRYSVSRTEACDLMVIPQCLALKLELPKEPRQKRRGTDRPISARCHEKSAARVEMPRRDLHFHQGIFATAQPLQPRLQFNAALPSQSPSRNNCVITTRISGAKESPHFEPLVKLYYPLLFESQRSKETQGLWAKWLSYNSERRSTMRCTKVCFNCQILA